MLSETHSFFSWGNPRIGIAKGIDSQPTPASAYNANYLKGQGGQKTPYAVGGPTKIPPSSSRLWDSNIWGTVAAMVGLEPEPKLQAQMIKSNQSYLQPNPKTAKYTPAPVPYSVPVVMKAFLASDKADAIAEKSEVDWLEIAGAQLSGVDEGSDEYRFWNEIVKQLTKIKVLQSTRALTEAENATLYSIINQIKDKLPEVSRVAPVAPQVPYGVEPPPEPEPEPVYDAPRQAAQLAELKIDEHYLIKPEAAARESREIANEEYDRLLYAREKYEKNESKGNLNRLNKQAKNYQRAEANAVALEAEFEEKNDQFNAKQDDMWDIKYRGRRGIPPPLPPAGAPLSRPASPAFSVASPYGSSSYASSQFSPAISSLFSSPAPRFSSPFVPSPSRFDPLESSTTSSTISSRSFNPYNIPSSSRFDPLESSTTSSTISSRSFDPENIPSASEMGFTPRSEDQISPSSPGTIMNFLQNMDSPYSVISSLNVSTRSRDSKAGRSLFFGALNDNIQPIGFNLNDELFRIHTPEKKPVATTLAVPAIVPDIDPVMEEKYETKPISEKEKKSSIVFFNADDYLEHAEPNIDYVKLAMSMKKITKAKWQNIAQGLGVRPMEGSTKESFVKEILKSAIMRQYLISESNLSGIGSDAKLYEIGKLAKEGKIDNSLFHITSLTSSKASRR